MKKLKKKTRDVRVKKVKNKVCMIEYQGRVDENGKALGHSPKVLNEYFDFIKEYCDVSVFAPREILEEFSGRKESNAVKLLPEHIVMGQDKTIGIKIKNKINMFRNIRLTIANADADVLWFFNVEYYLFLYLFLHKKTRQKIVCTMFLDGYKGGIVAKIKQFVFEQAQKKIDLIIATGKQLKFKNCAYKYVPDYYYKSEMFDKYKTVKKEKLAVCLGTMGKGKQLNELVETFNQMGYPLVIAGRFHDKELLKEIRDLAKDNIEIRDEYLSNDEYLDLLARARYTILPYSPDKYDHQTSGVMQEAIFLDTIPVSYKKVLDGNGIPGLGFDSWDKLDLNGVPDSKLESYRIEYKKYRENEFSYDRVKDFYSAVFETK